MAFELTDRKMIFVSIPKRVSEVLWRSPPQKNTRPRDVSIPKRVSEVLWPALYQSLTQNLAVSIPKRVSEVLWLPRRLRTALAIAYQQSFNP